MATSEDSIDVASLKEKLVALERENTRLRLLAEAGTSPQREKEPAGSSAASATAPSVSSDLQAEHASSDVDTFARHALGSAQPEARRTPIGATTEQVRAADVSEKEVSPEKDQDLDDNDILDLDSLVNDDQYEWLYSPAATPSASPRKPSGVSLHSGPTPEEWLRSERAREQLENVARLLSQSLDRNHTHGRSKSEEHDRRPLHRSASFEQEVSLKANTVARPHTAEHGDERRRRRTMAGITPENSKPRLRSRLSQPELVQTRPEQWQNPSDGGDPKDYQHVPHPHRVLRGQERERAKAEGRLAQSLQRQLHQQMQERQQSPARRSSSASPRPAHHRPVSSSKASLLPTMKSSATRPSRTGRASPSTSSRR